MKFIYTIFLIVCVQNIGFSWKLSINKSYNPGVSLNTRVVSNFLGSCNFLCNTDFEDDKLVSPGNFGFFHQDRVSCWNTTATDQQIEICGSGFGGVSAYSGGQFAELNANMVSTLFQNFTASLGSTVQISFAHRGRAGIDVMSVEIGPAAGPYQSLGQFSADNKTWIYHTLNYVFPDTGSTAYAIRFKSISAAGGATVGNFLDAISISLQKPSAIFTVTYPDCLNDSSGIILVKGIGGSPPYSFKWLDPLNSNDTFVHGIYPGLYRLEIVDLYGCSDLFDIHVNSKHENDTSNVSSRACDFYIWPATGINYSMSGEYNAVLQNMFGCDSVINLNLEILPSQNMVQAVSACGEYIWPVNGQTYLSSGMYFDTLKNMYSCDSIIVLDLNIVPKQHEISEIRICKEYIWPVNGKTYLKSGFYSDTLSNILGCDSILSLNLEILNEQIYHSDVIICDVYTWPVNGQTYIQSGQYVDTLINLQGCDSIFILDLKILSSHLIHENIAICDSYTWPVTGETYFQSGMYTGSFSNMNSCDSIHSLRLKILPKSFQRDSVTRCDSYTWPVNGKTYKLSGSYIEVYSNQYGCDSVNQLVLQIDTISVVNQLVSSCRPYTWPANGQNYTKSGNYRYQTVNSVGCDSIIHLQLQIHPGYQFEEAVQMCDSYTWPVNGNTYFQSGHYSHNLQSVYSCDSVYYLQLKIDSNYIIYDTIMSYEYFYWPVNKKLYGQSGVYKENYQSSYGCDSLRILILQIIRRGKIFIPNVFSPNGDGINDKIIIFSSPEIVRIDRFRIFTRWGELVFEESNFPPNDFNHGWDGLYKNQKMKPAVFVFTVEWTDLLGEKRLERGDFTLIR
jgi:gliding motility-associated-like protein